jgi:homoprotocatechuate degradation regulator HpaR
VSNVKSAKTMNKLPSTKRSLPIALIRAREKVMEPIREMLSETGLTEQQWRILRILSEYGPQEASRLADQAALLLPSQTRIVQTMTEKQLVTRQPHKTDRRKQTIAITQTGQGIIDQNLMLASAIATSFVTTLGQERYDQLLDILAVFEDL